MNVIDKITQNTLVEIAKTLDFNNQNILRAIENEVARDFKVNLFNSVNDDIKHYLLLTSLPFCFDTVNIELKDLWCLNCRKCVTVIFRKTMPTGNLHPKTFVIGDAPGVGDGELNDRFDRVWVYGRSSHLLRRALLDAHEYPRCWFTNLLKCSTPHNRPSSNREVNACIPQLEREINLLKPKRIILLGKHVQSMIPDFGIPTINLYHPTYFVRKGMGYKEYAKIIKEKLK